MPQGVKEGVLEGVLVGVWVGEGLAVIVALREAAAVGVAGREKDIVARGVLEVESETLMVVVDVDFREGEREREGVAEVDREGLWEGLGVAAEVGEPTRLGVGDTVGLREALAVVVVLRLSERVGDCVAVMLPETVTVGVPGRAEGDRAGEGEGEGFREGEALWDMEVDAVAVPEAEALP